MIRILAIGNSFSQDALAYLHEMAACGHLDVMTVNLYIGGCSLADHWYNAENDLAAYDYELNGQPSSRLCSIKEALCSNTWDYITFQQASHDSGRLDRYFPYLSNLIDYVSRYSPVSVRMIHQTWAYETDSSHDAFPYYGNDQMTMYRALRHAYGEAARQLGIGIIPCGDVIQALRAEPEFDYRNGGLSLCRDGYHMHLVYGRFTLAATWFEILLHSNVLDNAFIPRPDDGNASEELPAVILQTVHRICSIGYYT